MIMARDLGTLALAYGITLVTAQNMWSFPPRMFSVSVTKSAVSFGFDHTFTEEILNEKLHFSAVSDLFIDTKLGDAEHPIFIIICNCMAMLKISNKCQDFNLIKLIPLILFYRITDIVDGIML